MIDTTHDDKPAKAPRTWRRRVRRVAFKILAMTVAFVVVIAVCELVLATFWPLQYIVPASDWTPQYGVIAYPNAKIINAKPCVFRHV